ncbi:MAG: hypothetical protein IJN03_00410 [Bacilli bacterium]|nr:hypothetical protein [Bacilli bacterium]
MNIMQNIKDYQQTFSALTKDGITLDEYLEENNIPALEFLRYVGLNEYLVKEFNYDEMTKLAMRFASGKLPRLSTQFYVSRNTIAIDNNCGSIIINRDDVTFIDESKEILVNGISEILDTTTYSLTYSNINKKNIIVENIETDDRKILKVKAHQTIYKNDGEVISDNLYDMTINYANNLRIKNLIFRAINSNSILTVPAKVIESIKAGNLKREDVEISWSFNNQQKK